MTSKSSGLRGRPKKVAWPVEWHDVEQLDTDLLGKRRSGQRTEKFQLTWTGELSMLCMASAAAAGLSTSEWLRQTAMVRLVSEGRMKVNV